MIEIVEVPLPGEVEDVGEGSLIFPIPGAQKNTILFEPRDGDSIRSLTAKSVALKIGNRTALRVRKVRIDLFITDARVALACSRYDKGGGWVGGASAMVVFNTVSKARAALRSRGKMLTGQVRYPWLRWVVGSPKTGFGNEETLTMQCAAEDGTAMTLILALPKGVDAARVAAEIAERAARYRLAGEKLDEGSRAGIEGHLGAQDRVAARERQAFEMHAPWPVGEHSARLAPSALYCGACGDQVDAEDVFCSSCGEATSA